MAAQAADAAWQQTIDGHNGPSVTNPTVSELEHPSSATQDDGSDDLDFSPAPRKSRLSAPQLQAQLSTVVSWGSTQAPEEHTLLQGSLTASYEDRRPVPHACLSQKALPLRRMCGKCPDAARPQSPTCRKDLATGRGQAWVSADCVVPSWTHNWNTEKPAAPPKPPEDTLLAFTPSWVD